MKATGIVRRVDDLGRIVIPKEIRRTLRIREGDPSLTSLTQWEKYCFSMLDLAKRQGWQLYIVTTLESESARIREGRIGPGGHTFVGLVNNTRAELFMDRQTYGSAA